MNLEQKIVFWSGLIVAIASLFVTSWLYGAAAGNFTFFAGAGVGLAFVALEAGRQNKRD